MTVEEIAMSDSGHFRFRSDQSGLPVHFRFGLKADLRLVTTRYDKLAADYLAFVQLASIRL
jgi:hypothetical protein